MAVCSFGKGVQGLQNCHVPSRGAGQVVHFDLATRGAVWVAAREQMGAEHVRDAFPAFYDLFEWIDKQWEALDTGA